MIWLPWVSTFLFQRARTDGQLWMAPLSVENLNNVIWKVLAGGKTSTIWPDYTWIATLFFLLIGILLLFSRTEYKRLASLTFLVPLIVVVVYALLVRNILGVRYLIFAHVFFLMALVLLLGRGRLPALRYLCLAFIFSWTSYWTYSFTTHRDYLASFPGTQTAITYLNEKRDSNEAVVCGSPFVFAISLQYIHENELFYTKYHGDYRSNILSGPCIRSSDYENWQTTFEDRPQTLWTIDAVGLFGGIHTVEVPQDYALVSEERFSERFGYRMDLVVKEYRLK